MGKKIICIILNAILISGCLFWYDHRDDFDNEKNSVGDVTVEEDILPSFVKVMTVKPEVTKLNATPLASESSAYRASQYVRDHQLSSRQKECYDYIYRAVVARQTVDFVQADCTDEDYGLIATVDVSQYRLSSSELYETWLALLYDHVELFWVDESLFSYSRGNEVVLSLICPGEYNTYASRQIVNEELDYQIDVLKKQTAGLTEEEGAIYLCKYVAALLEYAQDQNYVPIIGVNSMMVSSIRNRTAICSGYSRIYAFLYRQLEPGECLYVSGDVAEGYHAWNYVCVNDSEWYAVDATFYDGGVQNVLLAGRDFLSSHIPDTPGLTYLQPGLAKFGYPVPELETFGYFEKQKQISDAREETQPETEPQNESRQDPVPDPEPARESESVPDPDPEASAEAEAVTEQESTPPDPIPEPEPVRESESVQEPDLEPSSEAKPATEQESTPPDPIPDSEPSSEAKPATEQESSSNSASDSEPVPGSVRYFDKNNVKEEDAAILPPEVFHDLMYQKYFDLGYQAGQEGKLTECINYYQLALSHMEKSESMFNMANAYSDLGMYEEAVKWYVEAYAHGDGEASIENCLLMLRDSGMDVDTKLGYLNDVANAAPLGIVYSEMASLYDQKGDREKATEYRLKAAGQ